MIYELCDIELTNKTVLACTLLTFILTIIITKLAQNILPHDIGRAYAVNGELSKGKPRGAGIIFTLCFVIISLLFIPYSTEYLIYCILLVASMLSGFFDDKSDNPWNEYKKGLIDLIIVLVAAFTVANNNRNFIGVQFRGEFYEIPFIVYIILAAILLWVSINVTNCSDGVDGLSGSLSVISLMTIYFIFVSQNNSDYSVVVLLLVASILGYLWFNISPSKLLMGDAGSRAIGFFIGVLILKTHNPLLFLLVSFMLIIDGGLGLLKVFLLRFLKIHIMKNIRTPIHDFARKTKGWSDSQVVFKFTVIQVVASLVVIFWIL